MAIGVDTSKWKPRRISGTPAAKFRNILTISIVCFGAICGYVFHTTSLTNKLRSKAELLYEDPVEEVERKRMIAAGLRNRTGDQIRRFLDESNMPNRPEK